MTKRLRTGAAGVALLGMSQVWAAQLIWVGPGAQCDFDNLIAAVDASNAGDAIALSGNYAHPGGTAVVGHSLLIEGGFPGCRTPKQVDARSPIILDSSAESLPGALVQVVGSDSGPVSVELRDLLITHFGPADYQAKTSVEVLGITAHPVELKLRHVRFQGSRVNAGGALNISGGNATARLHDVVIEGNEAVFGGAINCAGSRIIAEQTELIGNTANQGGAIAMESCKLESADLLVADNLATQLNPFFEPAGGGIYATAGEIRLGGPNSQAMISGNVVDHLSPAPGLAAVTSGGGGMHLAATDAWLQNTAVEGNSAALGGGILARSGTLVVADRTLGNCGDNLSADRFDCSRIAGNTATGVAGGAAVTPGIGAAIFVDNAEVLIKRSSILDNVSTCAGVPTCDDSIGTGAIVFIRDFGNLHLVDSVLSGNSVVSTSPAASILGSFPHGAYNDPTPPDFAQVGYSLLQSTISDNSAPAFTAHRECGAAYVRIRTSMVFEPDIPTAAFPAKGTGGPECIEFINDAVVSAISADLYTQIEAEAFTFALNTSLSTRPADDGTGVRFTDDLLTDVNRPESERLFDLSGQPGFLDTVGVGAEAADGDFLGDIGAAERQGGIRTPADVAVEAHITGGDHQRWSPNPVLLTITPIPDVQPAATADVAVAIDYEFLVAMGLTPPCCTAQDPFTTSDGEWTCAVEPQVSTRAVPFLPGFATSYFICRPNSAQANWSEAAPLPDLQFLMVPPTDPPAGDFADHRGRVVLLQGPRALDGTPGTFERHRDLDDNAVNLQLVLYGNGSVPSADLAIEVAGDNLGGLVAVGDQRQLRLQVQNLDGVPASPVVVTLPDYAGLDVADTAEDWACINAGTTTACTWTGFDLRTGEAPAALPLILEILDDSDTTLSFEVTSTFADTGQDPQTSNNQVSISFDAPTANQRPRLIADEITVEVGASTSVLADGTTSTVLANDTEPDGQGMTVSLVSGPAHGNLVLNTDGTFSYAHTGSDAADDSFEYQACDDQVPALCATATVAVLVTPVDDGIFSDGFE